MAEPTMSREGCCADRRKPCSYHEGADDMRDLLAQRVQRQPWVNALPISQAIDKDEWDV